MKKLLLLSSRKTNLILIIINVLISIIFFIFHFNDIASDHYSYLALAENLLKGQYSFWHFDEIYFPDTLRTPGYPFFLATILFFGGGVSAIKIIQLLLYFLAIILVNKILTKIKQDYLLNNIFLILLIPCIFMPYYSALVYTESIMIFLVVLFIAVYVLVDNAKWYKNILIALSLALIFYIKPVFLFLPIFIIVGNIALFGFKKLRNDLIYSILFLLLISPYAFWNLKHHNTFKFTPIEGGGGIMFIGYWMHLLPNYTEKDLWGTWMSDEVVKFVQKEDVNKNIELWKKDWELINSTCECHIKDEEREYLKKMELSPRLFKTYNTEYSKCREGMLVTLLKQHVLSDPIFYIKTRIYTFFRLQITSVHANKFKYKNSLKDRIILIYPMVLTLIYFILFYISIFFLIKKFIREKNDFMLLFLLIFFYCIIIHIPMALQSRYTIPVRMLMLIVMAEYLYGILKNRLLKYKV